MKWIGYFSFVLLFLHTSCKEQAPLSGVLTWRPDGQWSSKVYLIQARSLDEVAASFTGQILDSAIIQADGSFVFEKLPDAPDPILLELVVQKKGERFVTRLDNEDPLTANYFPIIWKNGLTLKVSASIEQFQSSFFIKNPSPDNLALLQLRDIRQEAFQQLMQNNHSDSHDEAKLLEEEAALLNFQQPLMDFAQKTDYLLPALLAIRWVSPTNDYERIPEFLFSQCQKWQSGNAGHPWVVQLCEKSNPAKLPVLKGDKITDTPLPMLSGDTVALYQMIGNKLTLLDLWASWCAPCRRENQDFLVPLWEKHHEKGFEIIGYALDAGEETWKRAIEKDGAFRWLQASHLRGDDAPLMDALRIQTIPANFLLNAEGEVLAKNLHGDELVKFVESYMEK